jgi:hypothetical protein
VEEKHHKAQLEQEAQKGAQQESDAEKAKRAEKDAARILAEQKRKDLERLEAELEAAAPVSSPGREKFGFFSRKRATTRTSPPSAENKFRNMSTSVSLTSMVSTRISGSNDPAPRGVIGQGGGGIVPGTDAPISASNAGERASFLFPNRTLLTLT